MSQLYQNLIIVWDIKDNTIFKYDTIYPYIDNKTNLDNNFL